METVLNFINGKQVASKGTKAYLFIIQPRVSKFAK